MAQKRTPQFDARDGDAWQAYSVNLQYIDPVSEDIRRCQTDLSHIGEVFCSEDKVMLNIYSSDFGKGKEENSIRRLSRIHKGMLTSVNNLGYALASQGKYEEAEAMHCRALS